MSDPEVEFNGDMGHLVRLILIYLIRSSRVCRTVDERVSAVKERGHLLCVVV